MIGTVRPATDEELRISRGDAPDNRKAVVAGFIRTDALQTWINENFKVMKRASFVGIASAAIVGLAVLIRKYTSPAYIKIRR